MPNVQARSLKNLCPVHSINLKLIRTFAFPLKWGNAVNLA